MGQLRSKLSDQPDPLWRRPGFIVGLIVVICLAVGLLVVTQYGESVDEPPRMAYAQRSLDAYSGRVDALQDLQDEKGPFFGMLALLGSNALTLLVPGWKIIDGWHYMSFLSFVMGLYFFYRLCRRVVDASPAIAATLLLGSQPVLWGHAFINPKDIPFMAFFIASMSLGLDMVDAFQTRLQSAPAKSSLAERFSGFRWEIANDWRSASNGIRRLVVALALLLAGFGVGYPLLQKLLKELISQAYSAPGTSWLGRLFARAALNAAQIPVDAYISKAQKQFAWIAFVVVIALGAALIWAIARALPNANRWLILLLAGCFLGFCSDIRTLGPASGLLVAVYFLYKARRKAIPYLLEYLVVGALTILIFWPYLWQNPISHYISSLSEAADFPYIGSVIFAGNIYPHGQLPFYYLPVLFAIQFSETAVALILAGIILAGIYLVSRDRVAKAGLRMDILVMGAWFAAPVGYAILFNSNIYNNFRQFLFVVPPLFFFAGLALQAIWKWLKQRTILYIPLVIIVLLPGLYWDWQLHPYQYVYYNSLVGGVAGASGKYEADYWFVTYKEAAQYVNRIAPPNSVVYFWISDVTALPYVRSDLKLSVDPDVGNYPQAQTFYSVILNRFVGSQFIFPGSKEIYEISRGGAVLAVIKQVNRDEVTQGK